MPTLNTNFTGSGIETTTPTAGAYGTGGMGFGFDPALNEQIAKLMSTRLTASHAKAEQQKDAALKQYNASLNPNKQAYLGGTAPDPELGRAQAANEMARQSSQEQQRMAQESKARETMLAQQAQDQAGMARQASAPIRRFGLNGQMMDVPIGTDENFYLQKLGYKGVRTQ
jgi:hypothetical protein